jgi:hypothetical protein
MSTRSGGSDNGTCFYKLRVIHLRWRKKPRRPEPPDPKVQKHILVQKLKQILLQKEIDANWADMEADFEAREYWDSSSRTQASAASKPECIEGLERT